MTETENTYRDENLRLIALLRDGDTSCEDALVRNNSALVRSIAGRFLGRGVDFDDLYQIGMMGLLRAVRTFDIERGCAFSTYAVPLIIGEIKRFLRDDGMIKVSRDSKRLGSRLLYEKERFRECHGRDAHISELAELCGVTVEDAAEALEATYPVRSISEPLYDDGEASISDTIAVSEEESIRSEYIALHEATDKMPELWQKIVSLRFYHDMSQESTARVLGLSQVKISREEKKIFAHLREKLS